MRPPLLHASALLTVAIALLVGCERRPYGPYGTDPSAVVRDTNGSDRLFREATPYLSTKPEEARDLLRQALDKDLYNGPAHNNLGVLLLAEGNLYEAAREFEWARKLLPGHPDPRVNLAIALEAADKHTDAIEAARAALEVQPGHLPAIQTLALIQVRSDACDEKTPELLAAIVQRSPDPEWRSWAAQSKVRLEARHAER